MVTLANVVCKGMGVAGMSAILYDAYSVGKANSTRVALADEADRFEKIHRDTRTLTLESPLNSAIQEKAKKIRMNSPISSVISSIKGALSGFFGSLADNVLPVSLASLALVTKGKIAKFSAGGLAAFGLFTFLREGFGIGKKSPIE